jgi:hypothetical protein
LLLREQRFYLIKPLSEKLSELFLRGKISAFLNLGNFCKEEGIFAVIRVHEQSSFFLSSKLGSQHQSFINRISNTAFQAGGWVLSRNG